MKSPTLMHAFQCGFAAVVLISLIHSSLTQSLQCLGHTSEYHFPICNQALVLSAFLFYKYLVNIHYFPDIMQGSADRILFTSLQTTSEKGIFLFY